MNQILDTGDNKKRKQLNIKLIIRFFSIFLLIFAICVIAVAVYSIINSKKQDNQKPEIQIESNLKEKTLNIKITDDTGIEEITYILNNKKIKLDGNSELKKELSLELINGKNTFKIIVTDIDGEQKEYEELYDVESGVEIKFVLQENKVNVNITSENKISYVTYRWNEQEEAKQEVNDIEYILKIDSPTEDGKYVLTINVVDEYNNTIEQTKEVIIDKEPTVEVTRTNTEFIIRAKDDEKLLRAELTLNGEKLEDVEINEATWEYKIPFVEGENKLIIKVYNLNEISKQKKVMVDTSKLTNE